MGIFNKKKDDFIKVKVEKLIDWNEPNGEGCMVSDKITKEGFKVGYMYREQPSNDKPDSGWRFFAGNEDDEYINNPDNVHIFANIFLHQSNLSILVFYTYVVHISNMLLYRISRILYQTYNMIFEIQLQSGKSD